MTTTTQSLHEPACKGKPHVEDHPMKALGNCMHQVGGATYGYDEFGCPDCGVTSRRSTMFACGTRKPVVPPTPENCLALAFKSAFRAEGGSA